MEEAPKYTLQTALIIVNNTPTALKTMPAIAKSPRGEVRPLIDNTKPVMLIGSPKRGMHHAISPNRPRMKPAMAVPLPPGSEGFGGPEKC